MSEPILVVLAAGMGSRYGGVKQIDAVGHNNETLLDFGVYDAIKAGFKKVVYIIRKDIEKDFRERIFDKVSKHIDATYVFQSLDQFLTKKQQELAKDRTKPWGTIQAVLCAKDEIDAPFCVINSDDYYGRNAFETMAEHLRKQNNDSTSHAMVGYVLKNTMSKQGSVSRAICTVKDELLLSMKENTKIYFTDDNKIESDLDGNKYNLSGNEIVSMNFFGFTVKALDFFEKYFKDFLKENINKSKSECFLPEGANLIVKNKLGSLTVYKSNEKWFGMTYSDDRANVKKEISCKIESGYYPEKLWS